MTKELKDYMQDFKISTEGEIFCNDLSFKYMQSNPQKQRNDDGTEDNKENMMELKRLLVEIYRNAFDRLVKEKKASDSDANQNLATAIYIATYFEENMSGQIFEKNYGE